MRTPQRGFVVEFKSGRRQSKVRTNSIWGDTDLKAVAREVDDTVSHPFGSHQATGTPDAGGDIVADPINAGAADERVGDLDVAPALIPATDDAELSVPKQQQTDHRAVDAVVHVEESQPASQPPASSGRVARKRAKRVSTAANAKISTGVQDDQSTPSTTLEDPVSFDEVAALEAENKRLKRLLAKQLHTENLQLRKMLERLTSYEETAP